VIRYSFACVCLCVCECVCVYTDIYIQTFLSSAHRNRKVRVAILYSIWNRCRGRDEEILLSLWVRLSSMWEREWSFLGNECSYWDPGSSSVPVLCKNRNPIALPNPVSKTSDLVPVWFSLTGTGTDNPSLLNQIRTQGWCEPFEVFFEPTCPLHSCQGVCKFIYIQFQPWNF
jgi:hypothetical protein